MARIRMMTGEQVKEEYGDGFEPVIEFEQPRNVEVIKLEPRSYPLQDRIYEQMQKDQQSRLERRRSHDLTWRGRIFRWLAGPYHE